LRTTDRRVAEQRARQLLAERLRDSSARCNNIVTLSELWERYRRDAPSYLDSVETTRRDAASRADVLLGHFGELCDVSTLTEHDVRVYTRKRLAGGIATLSGRKTGAVRPRSAEADLALLQGMLRWATTVRTHDGQRWLKENPLHGVRRIREQNPLRPIASWDRYLRTREAMQDLAKAATLEEERVRWLHLELALVLAEATGRRIGAIRQLRWEDFDLDRCTVRWRAEADKKRRESVVPLPSSLVAEIREIQKELGAIGGWVFARASDGAQPIPKLKGGLWHPYRRKWATERKHRSPTDVAAAGGWRDVDTLLRCYQQPDDESLLAVMSEGRKLREQATGR
jgi:integrase